MALPLRPRLNGAKIGTRTWPRPRLEAIGNGRQQVRRIELADIEPVAHIRPGHLAHQFDVEALLGGETLVDGHDQGCRVGQRDEADPQARGRAGPKLDQGRWSCLLSSE